MLTESIVGLGRSEEWFWATEPRIVIALVEKRKEIEREQMRALSAFIALSVWGKDTKELMPKKEEKIAGRDKPCDPALLRGFYGG